MSHYRCFCMAMIAVVGFGLGQSSAQTIPYKARGGGAYSPVTGAMEGLGVATHLGRIHFSGAIDTFPTANPLVFTFQNRNQGGPSEVLVETVGANGDTIFFRLSGTVNLIPLDNTFTVFTAEWTGVFEPVGGTGRFEGIQPGPRPLQTVAVNEPFTLADPLWNFRWTIDGTITLP